MEKKQQHKSSRIHKVFTLSIILDLMLETLQKLKEPLEAESDLSYWFTDMIPFCFLRNTDHFVMCHPEPSTTLRHASYLHFNQLNQ